MRPGGAIRLTLRGLARHAGRTALLVSGVVVGVAFLVVLLGFVEGMRTALVDRLVGSLPVTHLRVTTRQYGLGVLQFGNPFADLDSAMVRRVEAMPGVAHVLPMAALAAPAQMRASVFGQGFVTDTGVFGIQPEVLGGDLPQGSDFRRPGAGPIPAAISRELIDMYNTGFAEANGLPKLNDRILLNQDAVLTIGTSSFNPAGLGAQIDRVPLRIVAVSGNVPLAGISVPIGVVQDWNRRFAGSEAAGKFVSMTVVAEDAHAVEPLVRALEGAGLQVTTGRELAEKVAAIARYITLALAVVGGVVLLVAGLGIANALALSVLERRREIGLFRSVGASRGDIRGIFLLEALVLGAAGSALGLAAAVGLERAADAALLGALPESPFVPSTFFVNTWRNFALACSMGVFVSVLAGVSPASRAARLQPAEVLKGG
ncbi:MAG TPA: FtsX-like permease family protein [Gemmatimonadota bacterium]